EQRTLCALPSTPAFSGAEEVDRAVFRLRRKLRRFVLHPRTGGKLEAMWTLYGEIKRSSAWRISDSELAQFLRAIQRTGVGMAWHERAVALAGEAGALGGDSAMALLRVHAKFGDTHAFERTAAEARRALGSQWTHADYVATRAIAYARADLPQRAQAVLSEAAGGISGSRDQAREELLLAREELLLAWARARKADQAWAELARLAQQRMPAPAPPRVWNALLHMHAVDTRYRMELVEEVHARMIRGGGSADHATFNILMHAALVRGRQARWQHWHARMLAAGHVADAYTLTALAAALIDAGRWADAARAIRHMRASHVTPATAVSAMQMLRRRSRAATVMARFRQSAAAGSRVAPHEFTQAASAALADPRAWAAEIALLVRCLERGHVAASPAVDAVAARLPGLSAAAEAQRPLLRALRRDPGGAGQALAEELGRPGHGSPDHGSPDRASPDRAGSDLITGELRKSYAETVHAAARALVRSGCLRQAEHLAQAADRAQIGRQLVKEPDALAALVAALVAAGRLGEAAVHAARLERVAEARPSVRAFGALLRLASANCDAPAVESIWRRMAAAGVGADALSHRLRVKCYASLGDLLRTRRAYADMLDGGYAPHADAVAALVRCSVRCANVGLALTAVRHAERLGYGVASATYNCILSRCVPMPLLHPRIDRLLEKMVSTPDARLRQPPGGDVEADVIRLRDHIDHTPPDRGPHSLAGWLDDADTRVVARRLVGWLTSRAAYPAAPSLTDPGVRKLGAKSQKTPTAAPPRPRQPAPAPPPNATTFIIAMRFYGQNRRWAQVLGMWDALAAFNCRVSGLQDAHAETLRVVPFSRMIGWAALALVKTGRTEQARALWDASAADGTLSANACSLGMDRMLDQLAKKHILEHT
ncbi:hypothetical protein GGI20_003290, partial [Coemansia sp. BCRC 34301]